MPVRLQTLFDGFWRRPWLHAWWMVSLVAVPLMAFRHQSELMGCYLPASDRVREVAPGLHAFVARDKDMIRRRGENIAAAEIDRHRSVVCSKIFSAPGRCAASIAARPSARSNRP